MNFTIERAAFLTAAKRTAQLAPSASPLEVLKCALLEIDTGTRCLQKKRRKQIFSFDDLEQEPESDVLLETLVQTDERNRILWRCMDELAPAYREALYLVYFEGMRHAEAAAVMRKTEKQIADLVYRGRASLRKTLEREGITTWYI